MAIFLDRLKSPLFFLERKLICTIKKSPFLDQSISEASLFLNQLLLVFVESEGIYS